jgi:hypothetical protein
MGSGVSNALDILTTIFCITSSVCAFCTIVTFVLYPSIRTYPIKLLCYLCFCIMFGFSFFLISGADGVVNSAFCDGSAAITHFFFIAQFIWTFCIAFNFYQIIVRRNRESQRLEKWYHVAVWSISSVCILCAGASGSYGNLLAVTEANDTTQSVNENLVTGSGFCWITDDIARFFTFFIPGLFTVTSNAIFFFYIGREIHETLQNAQKSDKRSKKKEFSLYLSIAISIGLSWFFGYMMYLMPSTTSQTVFLFFFTFTTPLQGYFIFYSYVVKKKVAAQYARSFGRYIPWCRDFADRYADSTSSSGSGSGGSGSGSSGSKSGSSGSSSGSSSSASSSASASASSSA